MRVPWALRATRTIAERRRILRIAGVAGPLLAFIAAFVIWHDSNGLNRKVAVIALVCAVAAGVLCWYLSFHLAETNRDRQT
jgi:hypothetical protein